MPASRQKLFSLSTFLRRKLPATDGGGPRLRKVLSAWDLSLLGIGAIIGTGIFVLTGIVAATQAGPAVVMSFVVAGFACAFAALAYAELAASVGGSGSAYGYSYAAFGEFMAWIIGWDLILEYGVAVAAVANGWAGYLKAGLSAMGYAIPEMLTKGPFATKSVEIAGEMQEIADPGLMNLPALGIILVLMAMLVIGVKQSARFNAAMVFVKLLTIFVFIAVASQHVQPDLWSPFMPFGWFEMVEGGKTVGVLAGASIVFFAYVGFDAVSTAVEESKDPQRDVPIGILTSLAFCTVIYIVVSGLLTGIVSYKELNVDEPVAHALSRIGIDWASALVSTGVITGLTAVMLVLFYGLTRIIFAMSRDGLLPHALGDVNRKTHTPVRTTVLCGVIMAVMAGFLPLGLLAELLNIGTLAAFILVCGGVIVMRIRHPEMKRPFKTPGGVLIPLLGVLSCGALMGFLPVTTHIRFVGWLLIGILIYFAYGMRHSKLNAPAPKKPKGK